MVNRRFLILCLVVCTLGAGVLGVIFNRRLTAARQFAQQAALARQDAERIRQQVVLFTERKVAAGLTLADFLRRMGLDSPTAASIVSSAQSAYDLRHLRAGNLLAVGRSVVGELRAVRYQIDADRMLWILPRGNSFHAEIKTIPSHRDGRRDR